METFKGRRARARVGFTAVVLLAGVAGLVPTATAAAGGSVNTFVVSGKYHGTLTLANPKKDCYIDEISNIHLDSIRLDPLTGVLSGLKPKSWFFVVTEPKQGIFVNGKTARLRPDNNNVDITFSQTSGTIKFDGKTGSLNIKVVFNNGFENTVTETVIGTWSCPVVNHLG
jgi:hypothetical protein